MATDIEFINGLGSIEDDNVFLGKVSRNTKKVKSAMKSTAKKAKSGSKVNVTATMASAASASGKEMSSMVSMLSSELQDGLKSGSKQMVDATIYNVKSVDGKTNVRVYEDSDDKIIGICNIAKAKLEKNEVFCLSAIQVLYANGAGTSISDAAVLDWGEIPANMQNGEFTFRAGTQVLFDRFSMQVFKNFKTTTVATEGQSPANVGGYAFGQGELGFYKLANPKLIRTQEALDMFVEWNTSTGMASNGFLKVILYGTKIMSK